MKKCWVVENEKINSNNLEILNEYLLDLKIANRSEETIKSYRYYLERFLIHCSKNLQCLTFDDVYSWLQTFQGLEKSTIRKIMLVLSAFFNYCLDDDRKYIEKFLLKKCWWPKVPKSIPRYLETCELVRVKLEAESSSLRTRVMIELFNTTGCRLSEISSLNIDNLDLKNKSAKVLGKGKKRRTVYFTDACALLLKKYLEIHPKNTPALFYSQCSDRLSKDSMQKTVSSLGKSAKLSKKLTPHVFRHTFAKGQRDRGASLQTVQGLLGHANIRTTTIYTSVPLKSLVSVYRKLMG